MAIPRLLFVCNAFTHTCINIQGRLHSKQNNMAWRLFPLVQLWSLVHTYITNWHIRLYLRDIDKFDESTGTKHVAHTWNDNVAMKLD